MREMIWMEQCEAGERIRLRYGVKAAFDYLVAETLLNHAEAAEGQPTFARELPRFVARVRQIFTAQELRVHFGQLEREPSVRIPANDDADSLDDDDLSEDGADPLAEDPAEASAYAARFATIKDLLTATELGIS